MNMETTDWLDDVEQLRRWARDVFSFTVETMGMLPNEPLDELRGCKIPYVDGFGERREAVLFDEQGRLVWHDLSFYSADMFKNQSRKKLRKYRGTRFTWQQTVTFTAYNRALNTFGKDSLDALKRWIKVRSGHGIGKTGVGSVIAIHFLICFPGAQVGMTSNTSSRSRTRA